MNTPLDWHDDALICGIRVRAHFFDPAQVDARADFTQRNLPMLRQARPRLLASEGDGRRFAQGELCAVPDAVLAHGAGLICLEYKSESGRGHERERGRWKRQLKLRSALQCLAGAMAVSAELRLPAAAVLRCHNVAYLLDPQQPLVDLLAASVGGARAYFGEARYANASQLAAYCEARVVQQFRQLDEDEQAAAERGRQRHAQMLKA